MIKNKFLPILCSIFLLQGCSTVDIRSFRLQSIGVDEEIAQLGRDILQTSVSQQDPLGKWDRFKKWEIVTRDVWKSNWIRLLTPITQPDQALQFRFDLSGKQAEMTYLNGSRKGQVLGLNDKSAKLYLAPVRDYFFWPQSLVHSKIILYQEQIGFKTVTYDKIFVTNGPFEVSSNEDQYIVWINQQTKQIDFIEFTLRSLTASYRGVVEYLDYRDVQGVRLAHHIRLKDSVESSKYSHEFFVERMVLD